jgi:hypothetical protein
VGRGREPVGQREDVVQGGVLVAAASLYTLTNARGRALLRSKLPAKRAAVPATGAPEAKVDIAP